MKHQFRSNDSEGARWRRRAIRRLDDALRHLHWMFAGAKIRLVDINGRAGGVDKRCRVELDMRGAAPVVLSATARTWQDSLDAVASRLRRRVVAQLRRLACAVPAPLALATAPAQERLPRLDRFRRARQMR